MLWFALHLNALPLEALLAALPAAPRTTRQQPAGALRGRAAARAAGLPRRSGGRRAAGHERGQRGVVAAGLAGAAARSGARGGVRRAAGAGTGALHACRGDRARRCSARGGGLAAPVRRCTGAGARGAGQRARQRGAGRADGGGTHGRGGLVAGPGGAIQPTAAAWPRRRRGRRLRRRPRRSLASAHPPTSRCTAAGCGAGRLAVAGAHGRVAARHRLPHAGRRACTAAHRAAAPWRRRIARAAGPGLWRSARPARLVHAATRFRARARTAAPRRRCGDAGLCRRAAGAAARGLAGAAVARRVAHRAASAPRNQPAPGPARHGGAHRPGRTVARRQADRVAAARAPAAHRIAGAGVCADAAPGRSRRSRRPRGRAVARRAAHR